MFSSDGENRSTYSVEKVGLTVEFYLSSVGCLFGQGPFISTFFLAQ